MPPVEQAGPRRDPQMVERVKVRAIQQFGLGDQLVEVGEVVTVSETRASYLVFLQLAEWA